MATLKHGFRPGLMALEGREQPGSLFSTGLDNAILKRSPKPQAPELIDRLVRTRWHRNADRATHQGR